MKRNTNLSSCLICDGFGLKKEDLERLREWHCPLCYTLPEAVKQEPTLETIDKKLSDLKYDLIDKIEKKTNDQNKKWTDLFNNQDRDTEQVEQAVTQAVEKNKQKMDLDHLEREKRKKNIVIRKITESNADTVEQKREEDKATVIDILGLDSENIEYVKRVGKPGEGENPQPRPTIITAVSYTHLTLPTICSV